MVVVTHPFLNEHKRKLKLTYFFSFIRRPEKMLMFKHVSSSWSPGFKSVEFFFSTELFKYLCPLCLKLLVFRTLIMTALENCLLIGPGNSMVSTTHQTYPAFGKGNLFVTVISFLKLDSLYDDNVLIRSHVMFGHCASATDNTKCHSFIMILKAWI